MVLEQKTAEVGRDGGGKGGGLAGNAELIWGMASSGGVFFGTGTPLAKMSNGDNPDARAGSERKAHLHTSTHNSSRRSKNRRAWTMESNDGLSRKEKLAIWRAQRAGTGPAGAGGKGKGKAVDSGGSGTGVLAERATNSAGNGVPGKKRAGSHVAASKGERGRAPQRKPFQVSGVGF